MASFADIHIKSNERCLFVGRTGSGKTTLARGLLGILRPDHRTVVLDPKHRFKAPDEKIWKITNAYNPRLVKQVIREPFGANVQNSYDAAMLSVFRRGESLVYVDEVTLITPLRPVTPAYGALIRQGREPELEKNKKRGIGVWSATQRPKEIPAICYTESEHFFIFQLTDRKDRMRVSEFTGDKVAAQIDTIKGHEFLYYNVMEDVCRKMVLSL